MVIKILGFETSERVNRYKKSFINPPWSST